MSPEIQSVLTTLVYGAGLLCLVAATILLVRLGGLVRLVRERLPPLVNDVETTLTEVRAIGLELRSATLPKVDALLANLDAGLEEVRQTVPQVGRLLDNADAAIGEVRGLVPRMQRALANVEATTAQASSLAHYHRPAIDYSVARATEIVDNVASITTAAKVVSWIGTAAAGVWGAVKAVKWILG